MRKLLVVMFVVLISWSLAYSAEFYASRNSNRYHYPSCVLARRIKPGNLIIFRSPEQATNNGYVPCPVCRAPLPSI